MLDRVSAGVAGHSTAEEELLNATTDRFAHAPVVRYVLRNCFVHRGGVEYGGGYISKTNKIIDRIEIGNCDYMSSAIYCMSGITHQYFGHWLRDACPTALLAGDGQDIILDERTDWPDTSIYANAFQLKTTPSSLIRVDELHVVSDFAQGQLKRERYADLKLRLARNISANGKVSEPVYLRRGGLGAQRLVANEDDLCEQLSQRGFEIVELTSDFTDRYQKLAEAPFVVSIDGSHLNQAQFAMKRGSGLISLIPSDRFTMIHRGVANAMGLRYGFVVVEPSDGGYAVSIYELLKTIDMIC
jgi:capsular polysaccharide biosynthesis protein